jgi:hypothetical protein
MNVDLVAMRQILMNALEMKSMGESWDKIYAYIHFELDMIEDEYNEGQEECFGLYARMGA